MAHRAFGGALAVVLAGTGGCEIAEVVLPEAESLVVVEAILRPDLRRQRVLVHRSITGGGTAEAGANVEITVRDETTGTSYTFVPAPSDMCLGEVLDVPFPTVMQCYASLPLDLAWVVPGRAYTLGVRNLEGFEAFARTEVPAAFSFTSPPLNSGSGCRLQPDQPFMLAWSRSRGAWAYFAELDVSNLKSALQGLPSENVPDQVRLTGLAIAETDTTMVLPSDFGVFQRTRYETDLLLALRDGLPARSAAHVVVAAVDRNYVNAVRGGTFHPSGRVRVSSVSGDAVGLFGSAFVQRLGFNVAHSGGTPCS